MASRGINKVILVGNLGADPEVRYTGSGVAIANLSIATNERWRSKESSDYQERTEWHRVVMFSRLAEIAKEYLHKGQQVYIEGRIQTRKWQDQQGHDRYTTEIVANDMQMLGRRDDLPHEVDAPPASRREASRPAPASSAPPPAAPKAATTAKVSEEEFDDDIPF